MKFCTRVIIGSWTWREWNVPTWNDTSPVPIWLRISSSWELLDHDSIDAVRIVADMLLTNSKKTQGNFSDSELSFLLFFIFGKFREVSFSIFFVPGQPVRPWFKASGYMVLGHGCSSLHIPCTSKFWDASRETISVPKKLHTNRDLSFALRIYASIEWAHKPIQTKT